MRNKFLVLFISALALMMITSCSKEYYDTKAAGEDFLDANKKNANVVELAPSGVQYLVLYNNPSGAYPLFKEAYNLTIIVKYGSKFIDGTDCVIDDGSPKTLVVSLATESFWSVIVPKMRIGSKWRVWVPYAYAFKEAGLNEKDDGSFDVDPYTVLVYDVELMDAY
jgi:FKBP-type peptidyl-prolyl cis-trans isomerase FklB